MLPSTRFVKTLLDRSRIAFSERWCWPTANLGAFLSLISGIWLFKSESSSSAPWKSATPLVLGTSVNAPSGKEFLGPPSAPEPDSLGSEPSRAVEAGDGRSHGERGQQSCGHESGHLTWDTTSTSLSASRSSWGGRSTWLPLTGVGTGRESVVTSGCSANQASSSLANQWRCPQAMSTLAKV